MKGNTVLTRIKIMNIGVILAGGVGARLSKTEIKQYIKIADKECISHVIEAFANAKNCDEIVVVENEAQYKEKYVEKEYGIHCCCGGNTRNESIYNGLLYINDHFPECDKVLFHDGARPFIRQDIVEDFFDLLDENDCVVNCVEITDGIGKYMNRIAERDEYYISQTPEGFHFKQFFKAFKYDKPILALTHHLPEDAKIGHYRKFPYNLKLTKQEDLFVAEVLIKSGFIEYMKSIKNL